MHQYTSGVAPGADAAHVEGGKAAAGRLIEMVGSLSSLEPDDAAGLLGVLDREARRAGCDERRTVVANAIGFLTQAYEATAGLIGNTLLALAAHPDLHARIERTPALLSEVVREVLRHDAPVQNTRRFIVADGLVAGQRMAAGDTVLVVLAAANHDAAANPAPERFDVERARRRTFTFGAGIHACPGERLAGAIAQAGSRAATRPRRRARDARRGGELSALRQHAVPLFGRGTTGS